APTVAGLAERVRAARGAATDVVLQVDEVLPADVPHALSLVQQRFWLFERLRPGTPAFNLPCVVRLRGAVSPEALDLAVRDVLARHAPLRSTFAMGETDPFVRVASVPEHPLRIVDRRGAQFDGDVDALVRDELRTPFDLEQGPLFRATLYRLADDDSVLAAVMHHVVSDGTSIGLFYRDLSLAYRARSEGREPAFAPLELDYQGFAHWQRRRFTPSAIERELDYWRDELKSAPRLLDLPTDRPRLARQTFRGGHEPLEIDAALTRSLRSLAGSERASLFMVLLAAFQTLLGALAGQDDVVVAAPTAGRLERSFEDMIGLFINTLVLRGDLSGEPTFRELLRRTRHKTLAGFEHQDVPFEELVEAIDIDRREGGFAPFFQTLLVLEPDPADDIDLSGLRADAIEVHVGASMFDISLYLMERRDGSVSGYAEYNAEIFDPATIARLSDRLVALLGSAAARPDAPIDDLLHEGASSGVGSIIAMTPGSALDGSLVRLWEARAAAAGASIAVIADDATVTFGELDTRANMLARHLQALGVEPGDRVAVRMTRGADAVLAILAVLKAGAAYVPIDPRYPSDRQAYVLEHSQSAALLTQHALVDEATAALGVPVVAVDIAASWERGDTSPLRIVRGPDDPVYVIYTSGSTGRPKGVLGRQGGTVNRIAWGWRAHPFGDREVVAQRTSLAFVDSVWEIFGPLLGGVPIAVIPDEVVSDPRELVSMLADRGVTRIVLVPTLLDAILESDDDLAARLPALRHWVSSGEALRVPTVRRFNAALPGARLINLYGSSEVSADVTWFDTAELAPDADAVPLGRPLDDVAVALVDEHGEIVPPGAVGEIRVSGAAVALGYHDLPEATAERFVSEPDGAPAFRTGDLARLSSRGLLEYRGRRDDQVKIRGNRVELGEVESVLREHPAVSSASVAVREVASSPALIAYIVSPAPLDMDVLRRFLRKRLPEYMVPVGVVPLATLPLTPSGKVDRDALPDLQAIPLDDQRYVAPIDDVQRELASLFEEILERRPIGVADDFFDLGGHSLLAARLFRRIEQRLEVSLPLSVLLEGASVEDIAKQVVLVRDSPARSRRSVAIQTRGTRRPLFLVPGAGSRLLYLRHLARHLGTEQPLYALHDDPSHGDPAGSVEQLAARLIDDMRAVQPQGPYNLTGFSFGGIVAYEMAQQLTAAGERVASLVLLDTFHPAHPPPAANPGLRGLVRRVEHTVDLLQGFPAGERMTYVRSVASVLRERQMAATWQRLHRLAPKVERYWSDPVGDLERAWFARDSYALATYVPRPYSGRLTFLWAQHNTRTVDIYDTRRGWSELAETVVVPLAGSHATLLLEPLVQGVAASLRTLLAEAEDGD
ncbi:MAG TPA: amino acid adenylation domain-containing protein, partial [Gaiellales bacterium]